MSMHKIPLTALEGEGLRLHRLPIGTPSQLSDCFRQGVAWALSQETQSVELLKEAAALFRKYEALHLAKGTNDSYEKAIVNAEMAGRIEFLLEFGPSGIEYLCETEAQGFALEAIHQFCPELEFRDDGRTLLTPAQVETILRRMGWKTPGESRS